MPAFFLQHALAGSLALLGLLVPVAIYLWNRRPGQVVRVGSVRWLEAAANRRLSSIKPEQLLLFLLRAAMLGLLALAVAGPLRRLPPPPVRGQVLLSPALPPATLRGAVSLIDSLRRQGYELRTLTAGFPVLSAEAWTRRRTAALAAAGRLPAADSAAAEADPAPLWSLVQQAADSLPGRPLVVVAPTQLSAFRGTRPLLPGTVQWYPVPAATDSLVWAVGAWPAASSRLLLLLGRGSETGIRYQTTTLNRPTASAPTPVPGLAGALLQLGSTPNQLIFTQQGSRPQPVPVAARPLRWHLSYDAAHAPDARVLAAALRAAGSVLPLAPRLTVASSPAVPADSLDWLFWLRADALPASAPHLSPGLRVWQDAPGPGTAVATPFAAPGQEPVAVLRYTAPPAPVGPQAVLWATAAGSPLLTVHNRHFQLHTRLHPAWSELADSPNLPALLLPLLLPRFGAQPDPRLLDPAQLRVASGPAPTRPAPAGPTRDLTPWVVLAAGLLFGLERWLAARSVAVSSPLSSPVPA